MAKQIDPPGKERTSLYVSADILRGIKYIAFAESTSQTSIMDKALSEFIERWEKKNGPVPPQKDN